LTAFENDLRVETRAIAGGDGVLAEAMAVAEEKERFLADVFEGNGAAACQFVLLWKDRKERFGEERERFKFVAANRECEDGDVDGAGAEAVEKDGRDFFDYGELNLRESS